MWDRIWTNAHLATMADDVSAAYGAIAQGSVAAEDGRIAWLGPTSDLSGDPSTLAREVIDCAGAWITPALIDCHTHLVFAGDRSGEFERRLGGESYEAIARSGGGILSTVRATRAASVEELVESALPRLDRLLADGVGTVEIKSGYGLETASELRMLDAAKRLADLRPVRVKRTFLGAHALPPEFAEDRAGYVRLVCEEMIPAVAKDGLADAVDAFCEGVGFSPEEVAEVFDAARSAGLRVKLHAEQLSDLDGAALAARHGALSADHLEYLSDAGVAAMAEAGTVAVLLPGAFYALGETRKPPVPALRAAGVPMAVATDCNPGSSPLQSALLAMNMACVLFGLTPEEALAGTTRHAAQALGLAGETGALSPGAACDLAIWDIGRPAELAYWIGANPLRGRVFGGEPV